MKTILHHTFFKTQAWAQGWICLRKYEPTGNTCRRTRCFTIGNIKCRLFESNHIYSEFGELDLDHTR